MEHLGNIMGTYENTLGTSHGNISRTKTSQNPMFLDALPSSLIDPNVSLK
jgi:hypothetical protein